ncbi:MAG: M14 family zinc carboxypeptidase [Bacteroidales bacterium]|nr:M14 family zinc carboxypeptidase [Bacteroidales bacterium]MDD3664225.1 M14 family zinc carboxypeptidase [Bacteroidales bacterium]
MNLEKFTLFTALLLMVAGGPATADEWTTPCEKTAFRETPRYDATIDFCKRMAAASPLVHYTTFGKSPQGRDLPLMVLDVNGNFDPASVRKSGNTVLLIQACIHPGEPEGKDAGLMLLRDIAFREKHRLELQNVTILFIPIFNVDGHERFGPYNRINQNGPSQMGWRTTMQNLNLNRDFMKADAPEMQAWLKLYSSWLPDFFIDTHTTDGADYEYVLTYALEDRGNIDPALGEWLARKFTPAMEKKMEEAGFPVFPYVSFRQWHNPRSGLVSRPAPPMLSQGYAAVHNRPGLLVETHMLKPYKPRVESTLEILRIGIQTLHTEGEELRRMFAQADLSAATAASRGQKIAVRFDVSLTDSLMVDFKGIEYHSEKSDLTGGEWFIYGHNPQLFTLPMFNKPVVTQWVELPQAYIIPVEFSEVIDRLKLHGIEVQYLPSEATLDVATYRFTNVSFRRTSNEGRQMPSYQTEPVKRTFVFAPGSAVVFTNQRSSRLIAHLLEPDAQDSFMSWGFFNAFFEQKEYSETYVMEKMARKMLRADTTLNQRFNKFMDENPTLRDNQWEQLNWFYRQTPYYDQRHNIYPVGRFEGDAALLRKLLQ